MEDAKENGKSGLDLQNWLNRESTKCPTGLAYDYALSAAEEKTIDTVN